jgi:hypothetical protein
VSARTGEVLEVEAPVPRWWHGFLRDAAATTPRAVGTWSPKYVGPVLLKYIYLRSTTTSGAFDEAGVYLTYAAEPGPDYAVTGSPPPPVPGTRIEGWQLVRIAAGPTPTRLNVEGMLWPMAADEGGAQLRMDAWRLDYYVDLPTVALGMHVRTTTQAGQHYWRLGLFERVSRDLLPDLLG